MFGSESSSQTGTQVYMAPELLAGKPASTRSDIYSLGVVLYQLLRCDLRQPVTVEWSEAIKDPLLREDLRHCLAGNPADRFAGIALLAKNLRALPQRQAELATRERAKRQAARRHAITRVSIAAALVFLGLAAALAYGLSKADKARQVAIEARNRAELKNYFANIGLAENDIEKNRLRSAYQMLMEAPEQFRAWEWGHLLFRCQQDQMTLTHTSGVSHAWFTPDGKHVRTSRKGFVTTWDSASGRQLPGDNIPWNPEATTTLATSLDQQRVATATEDGSLFLWDPQKTAPLLMLTFTQAVRVIAFSPDRARLVTSTCPSHTPQVWDANNGTLLLALPKSIDHISCMRFSPDGKYLALATGETTDLIEEPPLRLFNAQTGEKLLTITNHTSAVRDVAFSPDGRSLATAGNDDTTRVFGIPSGKQLLVLSHWNRVRLVRFSPDGRQLLTGANDGLVLLWDAQTGALLRTFPGHQDYVNSGNFSPDGGMIATTSEDQTCKLWDLRANREPLTIPVYELAIWSIAFSPDGKWLAAGGWDNRIRLWNPRTGREVLAIDVLYPVLSLAFSPDSQRLATVSGNHTARVWDVNSGRELMVLKGHSNSVLSVAYSPDGRLLATGSRDKTARLWDARTGLELRCFSERLGYVTHLEWVMSVAFSPDSRQLASCARDETAKVWDVRSGLLVHTLLHQTNSVTSVCFSPDARWIATGVYGREAGVWDAKTGRMVHSLPGAFTHLYRVAFSPDSKRVATMSSITRPTSSSRDHYLTLWDTVSGHEVFALEHPGVVVCAAFSPDGKRLATFSTDQKIRIWDAFPWQSQESSGEARLPLEERLEKYKRQYWLQRLLADAETARQTNPPPAVRIGPGSRAPLLPPRDPKASPNLINLSTHYNVLLNENWQVASIGSLDKTFVHLAPGLHTFNGVQFDVRGLVQLARARAASDWNVYPKEVNISIGQKFRRLHILHAYRGGSGRYRSQPTVIGKLVWHYADNSSREVPIYTIRDVHYYSDYPPESRPRAESQPGEQAVIAWQGPNPNPSDENRLMQVSQSKWDNPRPDIAVQSVDYVSTLTLAAPFLLAITVE